MYGNIAGKSLQEMDILVVIDMSEFFLWRLASKRAEKLIVELKQVIRYFHKELKTIVFIESFGCGYTTESLKSGSDGDDLLFKKNSHSAMSDDEFRSYVKSNEDKNFLFVGINAGVCVLHTLKDVHYSNGKGYFSHKYMTDQSRLVGGKLAFYNQLSESGFEIV